MNDSSILSVQDVGVQESQIDPCKYMDTIARLHAMQTGVPAKSTPRIKRISYVHNFVGGGPPTIPVGDMVVLDEYDEEGNIFQKGSVIVHGSRRDIKKVTTHINPVDRNRKKNVIPIVFKVFVPSSTPISEPHGRHPSTTRDFLAWPR